MVIRSYDDLGPENWCQWRHREFYCYLLLVQQLAGPPTEGNVRGHSGSWESKDHKNALGESLRTGLGRIGARDQA